MEGTAVWRWKSGGRGWVAARRLWRAAARWGRGTGWGLDSWSSALAVAPEGGLVACSAAEEGQICLALQCNGAKH
eukprot:1161171-Pelagomonas_calceolata.AAC.1